MKVEAGSRDRLKLNIVPSHLVRFKLSLHLNPLIDSHIYRIVLLVSANNMSEYRVIISVSSMNSLFNFKAVLSKLLFYTTLCKILKTKIKTLTLTFFKLNDD